MGMVAYCFMPDHAHLLIEAPAGSNVIRFVHAFKQATGFAFSRRAGARLWQKSYFDRILRSDDHTNDVADYILANPVRAGLVERPQDYPYSGSLVYGEAIFDG